MRVNVYAEEMTQQVEIISKVIDGQTFTGVRFYLHLPVTLNADQLKFGAQPENKAGPFIHRPGDDDSSAVTFWGKRDLRKVLEHALRMLDNYHAQKEQAP